MTNFVHVVKFSAYTRVHFFNVVRRRKVLKDCLLFKQDEAKRKDTRDTRSYLAGDSLSFNRFNRQALVSSTFRSYDAFARDDGSR